MVQRIQANQLKTPRRPFWLPASSYYLLVSGFAAASFFLVLGVVQDGSREPEMIAAFIVAGTFIIVGIMLREIVLRNAREKYLIQRNRLDASIKNAFAAKDEVPKKFTLAKNAAAVEYIRTKSEAARVFDKIAEGHKEVFELCAEYRRIVAGEIHNIHPNSPRLKALLKGNEYALKKHKFHLLRWAELESKSLAKEAYASEDAGARSTFTNRAKNILEQALKHYPNEPELKESIEVLDELLLSIRLSGFMEAAEFAASRGDREKAKDIYEDALEQIKINESSESNVEVRIHIENAIKALGSE
jgi:tetratricopeptide (TPR) repeat protein